MNNFGLIILNEHINQISLLIYLEEYEINYLKSEINVKEINQELVTILIYKNNKYYLEIRRNMIKNEVENKLLMTILLNIPACINIVNIFSINYYNENSYMNEFNRPIPFIKIVLNIKEKYNSISFSNIVNSIALDNIDCNIKNFNRFDEEETTYFDFEIKILNSFFNNNILKDNINFNVLCKKCNAIISQFNKYCTVAPLPSEMLIYGSEMLTCDNCLPLNNNIGNYNGNNYNFFAQVNWICIGQYHISIHAENVFLNKLIKKDKIEDSFINDFFINEINNIYYNSQKKYEHLYCKDCNNNLGWINKYDRQYNFWKSSIIFNINNQDKVISRIFDNYSSISLLIHYIEKYIKKYSNIIITNSSNINQLIKLYILMKNNIKIKFKISVYSNEIDDNNDDNILNNNQYYQRFIFYNSVRFSYKVYDICNSKNLLEDECNDNNDNKNDNLCCNNINISLNNQQFIHLISTIKKNTLFSNNSSFNLSIFNDNFV